MKFFFEKIMVDFYLELCATKNMIYD